jgi:hypothetical protein
MHYRIGTSRSPSFQGCINASRDRLFDKEAQMSTDEYRIILTIEPDTDDDNGNPTDAPKGKPIKLTLSVDEWERLVQRINTPPGLIIR